MSFIGSVDLIKMITFPNVRISIYSATSNLDQPLPWTTFVFGPTSIFGPLFKNLTFYMLFVFKYKPPFIGPHVEFV